MRANLAFQNTLRVEAHGVETPDASQTLSAKRSRRARETAAHAHVSTPTEAEVDALLTRLADGSPSLLKAGITPPKPAWVPPKPAAADAAAFPAWLPVEAMPPAREAAAAAAAAKTPPKPTRAIHFATPGEATTAPSAHACATRGDASADRSSRLPIFERLYRQVPSGQRAKFVFPEDASGDVPSFSPRATSRVFAPAGGNPPVARSPKNLREKRREIALLTAELAARETAEAAGAADAAALVAAEMARRGGLLPGASPPVRAATASSRRDERVESADPERADEIAEEAAGNHERLSSDAALALAEAAARDALKKILRESPSGASRVAGGGAAFGSPTRETRETRGTRETRASASARGRSRTPGGEGRAPSDLVDADWRFADGAFDFGGGKAPWHERARLAESRRRAKAAAWEGEVHARAAAKAQAERLVDEAERELGRLRRRRAEIVTRQMRARALANAEADPKRAPRARAPWGFESMSGTLENIRNAATHVSPSSPGTVSSPFSPAFSPAAAHGASPPGSSPAARAGGAAAAPASAPSSHEKTRAAARGLRGASGAEAARSAAARVRAREIAKTAAAAAAAAAAKAQAETFRSRRAAEREKRSAEARTSAASSRLAPTAASVGKAARVGRGARRALVTPAFSARDARGDDANATTRTRVADASLRDVSERVDALERDVGLVRAELAARGDASRTEAEGLRAQMAAVLEMLSAASAPSWARRAERAASTTDRGVCVTGSAVKATTPPTPPRGAPPPRVDAEAVPASPARAPGTRAGPSPAASPRAAAEIPAESAVPFLSG